MIKKKLVNKSFWSGKKVFITGHTGFKGSWLIIWLNYLGAKIIGFSKNNEENYFFKKVKLKKNYQNIKGNITNYKLLKKSILNSKAEILIHLAAQPLVNKSFINPIYTLNTNIKGTVNVLECARHSRTIKSILVITSDKVYENSNNKLIKLNEKTNLGGDDIYSASKACGDIIANSYFKTYFKNKKIGLATVRAGNVIGGGDWSMDRLFPDIFKSIYLNKKLTIRNLDHSRPWQHVLDCIFKYLVLLETLHNNPNKFSSAWNIGAKNNKNNITIKDILDKFKKKGYKLNYKINNLNFVKEKKIINLSNDKFNRNFKLKDLSFNDSFELTLNWYLDEFDNKKTYQNTINQIKYYMDK